MGYHSGPSRLLWFVIGAGAATWYHKHHEMNHNGVDYWGHCRRAAIQEVQRNPGLPTPPPADGSPSESPFSLKDIPKTINNIPSDGWGWGERKEIEKYREQQDHLADLKRQATETMSDMTEATLDTVLSTVEALRVKLAENREQRRKEEERLKRDIEQQEKIPPRLI